MGQRYLPVEVGEPEEDGARVVRAEGRAVALVLRTGRVVDLRERDFVAMSPCPYCGAVGDRGHAAARHVDPSFGEIVARII